MSCDLKSLTDEALAAKLRSTYTQVMDIARELMSRGYRVDWLRSHHAIGNAICKPVECSKEIYIGKTCVTKL